MSHDKPSFFDKQSLWVAIASSLPLWFPHNWGAHWMYPISLPWIVYWTHLLVVKGLNRWYVSFLLWIPAVGMITWQRAILHLDTHYLSPSEGIVHLLKLMWQSQHHGWSLLLGGAIAAWFIHKRMAFVLGSVAMANGLSEIGLAEILYNINTQDWNVVSTWLISIEFLRVAGLVVLFKDLSTRALRIPHLKLTSVFLGILSLWLTAPFVSVLLWYSPVGSPSIQVPDSTLNIGTLLPLATPMSTNFEQTLDAQGSTELPKAGWWCHREAKPNWMTERRAFAALEVATDNTLQDIQPHLGPIFRRGISHIAFVTTATTTHWYPPFGKHLAFPMHHWILSPPPTSTTVFSMAEGKLNKVREGNEHCTVETHWSTTLENLSRHYLDLQTYCTTPIFLSIEPNSTGWVSPVPCSTP